jgi:hypothetical protein
MTDVNGYQSLFLHIVLLKDGCSKQKVLNSLTNSFECTPVIMKSVTGVRIVQNTVIASFALVGFDPIRHHRQ